MSYYLEIKEFISTNLNHPSIVIDTSLPFEWAKTFNPLISDCVAREDYEAAHATTDAIKEFLNQFLKEPLTSESTLCIPEIKEIKMPPHHISYGRESEIIHIPKL